MSGKKDAGNTPFDIHMTASGAAATVTLGMPSGDVYEGTVLGGKPHGRGRMEYKNGRAYEGDWQNGKRHGMGTMTFEDGDEYAGEWKGDKRHGTGTYRYADGGEFVGEWKDGKYHGQGTRKYANGAGYEGEWEDDKRHGVGTLKYASGNEYEGEWMEGERQGTRGKLHGEGKKIFANGDVYEGGWKDDKLYGKGKKSYTSGNVYEGEFKDNKMHGTGTWKGPNGEFEHGQWKSNKLHGNAKKMYANGDVQEGGWNDGERHGIGTYKYANGNVEHGQWKNGKLHGNARKIFNNGDEYIGHWENDTRHGRGTLKYVNGDEYSGEWMEGVRQGIGTHKYANGAIEDGGWKNDKLHGNAKKIYGNGDVYEGGWKDGKRHGLGTYKYADGSVNDGEWKNGTQIFLPAPTRETIGNALSSVLLKGGDDKGTVDGIDGKFISYLADLLHESSMAQRMDHRMEAILRPWLKGFSLDGSLAKECVDAVMQCPKSVRKQTGAPPKKNDVMFVNVVEGDGTKERYALLRSSPFEAFLKTYTTCKNVSVRRFEHNGSTLFLSSIGKKSPKALRLKDGDDIKVVAIFSRVTKTKEEESRPNKQTPKGNQKKNKRRKKSNKKRPVPIVPPESEEEKWKTVHSQALSIVFEEADLQLREIRQRLAAMNLQRTMPKQRTSQPKEEPAAAVVDNPPSVGVGGKAGKAYFIVSVGEATNLYNTRAKPSNGVGKQSYGQIAREVDLHGCTKEEALAKLDECLLEWMDAAMKGEYPWVIAVRIVCGGGSQTLAEAVEGWIKRNPNVSNAPKNLYS